jgi:peroxiredoxin
VSESGAPDRFRDDGVVALAGHGITDRAVGAEFDTVIANSYMFDRRSGVGSIDERRPVTHTKAGTHTTRGPNTGMLSEGTTAPDFELPGIDPNGDADITSYRLSELTADGPVLLNFYLFDFHPECTTNLCSLHDLDWFELDPGVSVLGISTDRTFSHRAFADEQRLGFPLLSDSDGSVSESYDVLYDEFQGHKRIAKRSVFLLDTDRRIRYAWATEDPSRHPDWEVVRDALDDIR